LGEHHFLTSTVHTSITVEIVTRYAEKPILVKKWVYGAGHENFSADELGQIGSAMALLHQFPAPDYLPKSHPCVL